MTEQDPFGIGRAVEELAAARRDWRETTRRSQEPGGRELPSGEQIADIVEGLRAALFPMRLGPRDLRQENENRYITETLSSVLRDLEFQARLELRWRDRLSPDRASEQEIEHRARSIVQAFTADLGTIRRLLDSDVIAAFSADPAAREVDEVLLCYPGAQAIIHHRLAHRLHHLGLPLIARLVAEIAHSRTGIDIHPGATIGGRFFIDHGTGVVIGATSIIGEGVTLFQAVTLGARSFPKDSFGLAVKGMARHPILEDGVTVYSGATILGRITIGQNSVIGGNTWVTEDVPPNSVVTQARNLRSGM